MNLFTLAWFSFLFLLSPMVEAEVLLKTQTSWDGGEFRYPTGQAEITSFKLRIEEDQVPKFHCHPVPTLGYILKGSLEVETKSGKKVIFKEGESLVEVMRTIHRGKAIDAPVELIVFYAGSTSMPNTVFPEEDSSKKYCSS